MGNIPGLNKEESEWVCEVMKATINRKEFTNSPPTDRALDFVAERVERLTNE